MTEPYTVTPQPVLVVSELDNLKDYERKLLEKVGELRLAGKRVIILVDGTRLLIFEAVPRGTVALD
jgi:hypothetical protein